MNLGVAEKTRQSKRKKEQVHILISGLVQGVSFRRFVCEEAIKLGITGWVKNTNDRKVEILAQGEKNNLSKLIQSCRKGPLMAIVDNVKIEWGHVNSFYSLSRLFDDF